MLPEMAVFLLSERNKGYAIFVHVSENSVYSHAILKMLQ